MLNLNSTYYRRRHGDQAEAQPGSQEITHGRTTLNIQRLCLSSEVVSAISFASVSFFQNRFLSDLNIALENYISESIYCKHLTRYKCLKNHSPVGRIHATYF